MALERLLKGFRDFRTGYYREHRQELRASERVVRRNHKQRLANIRRCRITFGTAVQLIF